MSPTKASENASDWPYKCPVSWLEQRPQLEGRGTAQTAPGVTSPQGGPMDEEYTDDEHKPFEDSLLWAALEYIEHCGFVHNYENGTFSNEFLQWAETAYWEAAKRVRLPVQPAKVWESDKPKRKAISGKLRTFVYERDEYACVQCGSRKNLNVDHIKPVDNDGDNDPDNLQTLCRSCNSRKGAKCPG